MCTQVTGFDAFRELYLGDSSFKQIYAELMDECKRDNLVLVNGYVFQYLWMDGCKHVKLCSLYGESIIILNKITS